MRPDMNEVIVETARHGGIDKGRSKKWKQRFNPDDEFFDGGPSKSSMMDRRIGYNDKSQSDKLGPLRNFLQSRVGRKWDDVYSEICAVNDKRSILGYHLHTHLKQYVVFQGSDKGDYGYQDFFVEDGILWLVKKPTSWRTRNRHELRNAPIERLTDAPDGWTFEKIKGIWYRTKTVQTMGTIPAILGHDGVILRPERYGVVSEKYFKFQCSKRELREIHKQILAIRKSSNPGLAQR